MNSDAIISVEGLGKRYRLGSSRSNERYTALRDVIATRAAAPFRALNSKWKRRKEKSENKASPELSTSAFPLSNSTDDFWALKNVSFEVRQGEVVASGSEGTTLRPGCLTGRKRARRGIIGRNSESVPSRRSKENRLGWKS